MRVRAESCSLLLTTILLLMKFCPLLTHDSGHVLTQFIDEDSPTYLKVKYPSACGKLTFIALEQVPGLFSIC